MEAKTEDIVLDEQPDKVSADLRKFNKTEDQVNKALAALGTITGLKDQVGADAAMDIMKKAKQVSTLIENKRKLLVKPYNDEVGRINDYAKAFTKKIDDAIELGKKALLTFNQAEADRKKKERTESRHEQLLAMGFVHHPDGTEKLKSDIYLHGEAILLFRSAIEQLEDAVWVAHIEQEKRNAIAALQQQKNNADFFGEEVSGEVDQKIEELKKAPEPVRHVPSFGGGSSPARSNGMTKRWTFEIISTHLLPREYLVPDEKAIRAAVIAGTRTIAGVRIYQDESISLR